ncbi:hypothetical protein D3C81_1281090 [compost metagenome]
MIERLVHGLRVITAAAGPHAVEHLLERGHVVGHVPAAHEVRIAAIAVGHQAQADVRVGRQLADLTHDALQRLTQLVDFIAHRAGGIDHEHQVQLRACRQCGIGHHHLQGVLLPALQRCANRLAASAHLHLVAGAVAVIECIGVQPHLATGIGARPHPCAVAGTHRHFGIGHRASLCIHHFQALSHADVTAQLLGFVVPLQELPEAAEVGVVIDHAGGDRRLLLTHGGRGRG